MIAGCILLAIVVLVLALTYSLFRFVFYSPNRTQNDDYHIAHTEQMDAVRETATAMIRKLREVPYEAVHIQSRDGLRLAGRYFQGKDGAPVILAFHGYRGTPFRDFSGGTQLYFAAGLNLLMAEQRAHCGSEGNVICFGVKERFDCLDWIEYIRDRFGADTPILLAGISMGAATVLMASGLDLPENVKGIVADSPYTSPKAIIRKVCGDVHVPAGLSYPFLWLGARLFGGFSLTGANAAESVKKAEAPILLIHGEDDRFVPCEMGREIAAANPGRIDLQTFPDAGHGLSFLIDRTRYETLFLKFLDECICK